MAFNQSQLNKLHISLLVGLVLLLMSSISFAQQSPQFSIFSANSNIINPAYSGWKSNNYVALQFRDQWTGYTTSNDGSGRLGTTWLSGSFGIAKQAGLGFQFYTDRTPSGVSQQLIQFQGAYHLSRPEGVWSFGLSAGLQTKAFDGRTFRVRDPNDPVANLVSGSPVSQTQPDFGLGAVYSRENWQVGFTADHLTSPAFDFNGASASMPLERAFALHGSGEIPVSDYFDVLPYALVRYYSGQFVPEGGARVYYNKLIYAGAAYRNGDAAMGLLGVSILQNKLDIGYAIDITTSNSLNKKALSHEVFLRFRIPEFVSKPKVIPIRTPRFRIL
jgi:type IX secretion system PorP/SprF family membrane protein